MQQMLSRARLDWRCSSHLKKITSPGMRARRGVHVGREKSWAVVEISPARHQSTADQRCCGDGELQRSEADVDKLNQIRAALTDSRVEYGSAVLSIYRLHCYSGRVHQYQLDRNTQTRLSDKSKSPVRLLTSSNCCLSVWPKPCWAGSLSFLLPQAAKVTSRSI